MSVSAVSASSTADSSLLASLGVSSNSGDAVTADLKAYAQAKNSGDSKTADAAIVQLKSDLQSEMQQLLAELEGSATDASSGDSDPLSSLLDLNSNSGMSTLLANIQSITAQGAQSAALVAQATAANDDAPITTGTQMNVSV